MKNYFLNGLDKYIGNFGGHRDNARSKFKTPKDYINYKTGDGNTRVILHILDNIGVEFNYCLDIGAYSSNDSNVFPVMKRYEIDGLLIDGENKWRDGKVLKKWITKENICEILSSHNCPKKIDFI